VQYQYFHPFLGKGEFSAKMFPGTIWFLQRIDMLFIQDRKAVVMIQVFTDNFSQFQIGPFPYDPKHSAIGEYHYFPTQGFKGFWYDPIVWYGWLGPSWIVTEGNGDKYMEQTRPQMAISAHWPTLVAGESSWKDYSFEVTLRLLSTDSFTGIAFRYTHARRYYFLCFGEGYLHLMKRDQEQLVDLATVPFASDCDSHYRLCVECTGSNLMAFVDGNLLLCVDDDSYAQGRIALVARMPAQFSNVAVSMTQESHASWIAATHRSARDLVELRAAYPQPHLWKCIDLKNFGTGRQIRFGHLTGNSEMHMVLAQHQKRGYKDAYAHISCLTAIDLDGKVLWQLGEPSIEPDHAIVSCDLPVQVCDIDGDGIDEVIVARDFKLMILDGRTGAIRKAIPTPLSDAPDDTLHSLPYKKYAFDRVNVDAIRICNFSGKPKPCDILIKDRYSRLWAYDNELNLLWHFHAGITGHFPYTADINGDGRDEMFVGYHLVDADGHLIWTLPVPSDHTDEILIGRWDPEATEPQIAIASGDEGFMVANLHGELLVKKMLGHAQRISVGNYRPDLPGLELSVTTFWGCQGIIYLYDCKGNLLDEFEPCCNGNLITPVNWTGDGRDLRLLNGNAKHGGLVDGYGRRVVTFPDDGHPDLCAEVINLTGDARDDIVLWDQQRMYIYTQDRPADTPEVSRPLKYPHYNASNYRGEYNYPPQGL
jgi:rhamnogalacturonan endolyase